MCHKESIYLNLIFVSWGRRFLRSRLKTILFHFCHYLGLNSFASSSEHCWISTFWRPTFLVHVGLFWYYVIHQTDRDYRIFNVCMWSFWMHICMGGTSIYSPIIQRIFCRVCTEFHSGEVLGWALSMACNDHPSIWWPCSTVFNLQSLRERVLSLCTTDWTSLSQDAVRKYQFSPSGDTGMLETRQFVLLKKKKMW